MRYVLFLMLPLLVRCTPDNANSTNHAAGIIPVTIDQAPQNVIWFMGSFTYRATATGTNKEGVELFQSVAAQQEKVTWGESGYRQEMTGGMHDGKAVVINLSDSSCYLLDEAAKKAAKGFYYSIDEVDEQVKSFMADKYTYQLTDLQQPDTILGYPAKAYQYSQSGWLKPGAVCTMWITDQLYTRPSRYNMETDWYRIISTLPLNYGISKGVVLKCLVVEDGVEVTYEVTEITPGTPDATLFTLPPGYTEGE